MDYELDWTRFYENRHHTNIAILTGLPIEEIIAACPTKDVWGGQDFVRTLRKLGFNTNDRFIKFDPETDKPCLLRLRYNTESKSDPRGNWYFLFVYYRHLVDEGNGRWRFDDFMAFYKKLKITSMLQVWI